MTALYERERTGVGPLGEHEPARDADLPARLPGFALSDEGRSRQADRQRPPDDDAERRLPDERRLHQPRRELGPTLYERLCEVCGKPEWKTHPQFGKLTDRTANRPAFNAALGDVLKEKPTAYWVEKFDEAGIPAGPINTIDKVFADPQVQHLGIAAPVEFAALRRHEDRRVAAQLPRREKRDPQADAGSRRAHRRSARVARLLGERHREDACKQGGLEPLH